MQVTCDALNVGGAHASAAVSRLLHMNCTALPCSVAPWPTWHDMRGQGAVIQVDLVAAGQARMLVLLQDASIKTLGRQLRAAAAMADSALLEFGNVLCCAYLNGITYHLDQRTPLAFPGVPIIHASDNVMEVAQQLCDAMRTCALITVPLRGGPESLAINLLLALDVATVHDWGLDDAVLRERLDP